MTQSLTCPLCGHEHSARVEFCESCGNRLAPLSGGPGTSADQAKRQQEKSVASGAGLHGWKIVLAVAVVLAAVLIVVNFTKEEPAKPAVQNEQGSLPPDHPPIDQAMLGELQTLEQAVRDNPENQQSVLNLANRLMDMRVYPRAIEHYRQYLQLNPKNPDARVDMAVCYFQLAGVDTSHARELTQSALAEMVEALKFNPKHQVAMLNLGIVNLQLGDVKTSQEWFRKCIDTDPKNETAQKAKQLLNQHTFNQ